MSRLHSPAGHPLQPLLCQQLQNRPRTRGHSERLSGTAHHEHHEGSQQVESPAIYLQVVGEIQELPDCLLLWWRHQLYQPALLSYLTGFPAHHLRPGLPYRAATEQMGSARPYRGRQADVRHRTRETNRPSYVQSLPDIEQS